MTQSPRQRTDRQISPGAPWTLIGPGCLVRGDLILTGNVIIHGRVEGTLFTDGELRVAPEGQIEGGAHARRIVVEGSCRGRVEALESVFLAAGSVVHAQVTAPLVDVDDGARFFNHEFRPPTALETLETTTFHDRLPGSA